MSEKEDDKICLKLTCYVEKHEEYVEVKPTPKPKPPTPKQVKPKIEKPKKPKILEKTVEQPKVVQIVKEEVQPIEEPEEVYVEPVKEVAVEVEEVAAVEPQEEEAITQEQQYMDEHIKEIIRLLSENLYYPRSARKRGVVGEVIVKFRLSMDAQTHSIEIVSSKSEILSRAARKTIEDLSGEFPKPREELLLHVPINYELK